MALTADQLNTIYQNVLFRNVDTAGIQFFANRSDISDAQVRQQIELSPEASTFVSPIVRLYQEVLGRVPDQGGLKFFSTQLRAGQSLDNIAQQIINSSEFQAKSTATSGAVDATDLSNTNQLVTDAFQSILGRTPASSEFQFFTGKSAAQILSAVAGSSEAAQTNAAGVVSFLDAVAQGNYPTGSLNNNSQTNTGQLFALTTGVDSIVGTAGNDTVNGALTVEGTNGTISAGTLSTADTVNGGAGTDALNITIDGATKTATATAIPSAGLSNVETVNIRNVATGTGSVSFDASAAPGVTAVNSDRSTGTVTVTNLAAGATAGVIGNGVVTNGASNFGYASATSAINLAISGGTKGTGAITFDATGATDAATTATISSTGAANTVGTVDLLTGASTLTSLTINAATNLTGQIAAQTEGDFAANSTLTINGAASSVTLSGALANALTTVNAAGLTSGGVTATLGTGVTNFTGGGGNDVITTAATTATGAVINAGAGTGDVLNLAATNDVTTSAKAGQYTNFEVLRNSTTSDVDVSLFSGITSVELNSADAGALKMSAAQAAAVTVRLDNDSNVFSLNNATGTTDVLKVTLQNATTATASADFTNETINGFETLQVVSASGSAADINKVSFASNGAQDLTALTLSGAFPISVDTTNIAKAVTIDASGVTYAGSSATDYAFTITGNVVKGSVINGSGAADSITTTAQAAGTSGDFVTYNAGAGNDLIKTSISALNNTDTGFASVKIDGGAGTDTLQFGTGDATFTDNSFQFTTNIEKIVLTNTTALSFTSGGYVNTNFANGLDLTTGTTANDATQTINLANYTGAAKITSTSAADGASAADNIAITTGTGADTVSVTASSFVGAVGAAGNINVATGAGNDTISVTTGTLLAVTGTNAVNITGGAGADTITVSHTNAASGLGNFKFNFADGDSTLAARDKITGFQLGGGGKIADTLDLVSTATIAADTAGTNGTDVGALKSHAIANGILTFGSADSFGTPAVTINQANLSDAISYLNTNLTTANTTVAFTYDSDSNGTVDATIVFQKGTAGNVIELAGVTGTSLSGTNGTTTGLIHIA